MAASENDILRRCPLFKGMTDEEIAAALRFYRAARRRYQKGDALIRIGDSVSRFALVLSGTVQIMSDDLDGHHMIMATVTPGQTFAESMCYQRTAESQVYAVCVEAGETYWMSTERLLKSGDGECLEHADRFLRMLTLKTLSMNDRIQILSKPTIRQKLMTLFSQYAAREGHMFNLPFDRSDMAVYLGVNRSALSRELSLMKKEGIIDFYKNSFSLPQGKKLP